MSSGAHAIAKPAGSIATPATIALDTAARWQHFAAARGGQRKVGGDGAGAMTVRPSFIQLFVIWSFSAIVAACGEAKTTPALPLTRVLVRCDAAAMAVVQPAVIAVGDARIGAMLATETTDTAGAWLIDVSTSAVCADCFEVKRDGQTLRVSGGPPRGVQYGVTAALESLGYRFNHPKHSYKPLKLPADPSNLPNGPQTPFVAERRGLHLHTIHPTEAYFDFWLPSDDHLQAAINVGEFVLHHRGNYLQWVALDDITDDIARHQQWRDHTRAINKTLHQRGLQTGIALQLFGESNLQKGFDLIDSAGEPTAEMHRRLQRMLEGNGFDVVNLSFGEFSGADPAAFVQAIDAAYVEIQKVQPNIAVTATIHVGNMAKLQVTYQGKTQLYYFLVQYAKAPIRPWVHTVMFYDLFEDAGGAYNHAEFTEHRQFLLDRLKAAQPVGYFPETAYWVAFDVCVPLYLPLYQRSRWLDLDQIAQAGSALGDHILFSSGWEWGYWQNDALALDASYTRFTTWQQPIAQLWAAWGEPGVRMSERVVKLADLQHEALLVKRLAPWLAGREAILDVGFAQGIFAQPDRPSYAAIRAMAAEARASFTAKVAAPLAQLGMATTELAVDAAKDTAGDPWLNETADGMAVTGYRATFGSALLFAVLADAAANPKERDAQFAAAQQALGLATQVVHKRHQALWDGGSGRTTQRGDNATLYPYGYLHQADAMCFWQRELAQVRNLLLGTTDSVEPCIF